MKHRVNNAIVDANEKAREDQPKLPVRMQLTGAILVDPTKAGNARHYTCAMLGELVVRHTVWHSIYEISDAFVARCFHYCPTCKELYREIYEKQAKIKPVQADAPLAHRRQKAFFEDAIASNLYDQSLPPPLSAMIINVGDEELEEEEARKQARTDAENSKEAQRILQQEQLSRTMNREEEEEEEEEEGEEADAAQADGEEAGAGDAHSDEEVEEALAREDDDASAASLDDAHEEMDLIQIQDEEEEGEDEVDEGVVDDDDEDDADDEKKKDEESEKRKQKKEYDDLTKQVAYLQKMLAKTVKKANAIAPPGAPQLLVAPPIVAKPSAIKAQAVQADGEGKEEEGEEEGEEEEEDEEDEEDDEDGEEEDDPMGPEDIEISEGEGDSDFDGMMTEAGVLTATIIPSVKEEQGATSGIASRSLKAPRKPKPVTKPVTTVRPTTKHKPKATTTTATATATATKPVTIDELDQLLLDWDRAMLKIILRK
jgi:hypothetical protein